MSLRPLRSAIEGWAPGRGIAADPLHRIVASWPGIVGRDVAAHSRPLELNGATLLVATGSSAWSQQLQLLSPKILDAIRALPHGADVRRLGFRSGALRRRAAPGELPAPAAGPAAARVAGRREAAAEAPREPAADAAEALERLRTRMSARLRTAAAACAGCGLPLDEGARGGGDAAALRCAPCAGEAERARLLDIQRLIYMAPWLTHAELRSEIPDLGASEFERARRLLSQRWWLVLERARRAGALSPSRLERHVASSYVLLQSRLPPDRITPAVVANLLGDDLVRLLWPEQSRPLEPGRKRPIVE
jgi:hypothetical protein